MPADPMGTTLRTLESGRIVVRNTVTFNPEMRYSEDQITRAGRRQDSVFRARFPMLQDVTMAYRWGGHLCLSLNSVPAFGTLDEAVYVASCQNSLGVAKGTLHGKLIADLACGIEESMAAELLALAKPRRLPPEPLCGFGVRGKLWRLGKRAGRDR